jgi:hypothetical protein
MTPEQLKTDITAWCTDKTGLQLVEDRSEAGADLALGLRSRTGGGGTVPIDVRLDHDDERVTIRSSSPSAADSQALERILAGRPALVRADSLGGSAVVSAYVYLDGLTKQSFLAAVDEVAKTRTLVDAAGGASASPAALSPAAAAVTADASTASPAWSSGASFPSPTPATPSSLPTPTSLPTPSFGTPAATSGYSPLSGQQASPQPQPAAAAPFAPTHTVPPQGMQAWAAPDPNGAVVATLGGGLPIQVTEVRGAWANIVCSNGWTGWVDGRIIGVAR